MQTQTSQAQVALAIIPEITVHGRFQPPVHVNHWAYIRTGFDKAQHVTLLIMNPFNDEAYDSAASWRNDPSNNPFSFEERSFLFRRLFRAMGIGAERYSIRPFNIKDPASFRELDPAVPNLVDLFAEHKLLVVRLHQAKLVPVSGTILRQTIRDHQGPEPELSEKLVTAGFMPQAVPGLLTLLRTKNR